MEMKLNVEYSVFISKTGNFSLLQMLAFKQVISDYISSVSISNNSGVYCLYGQSESLSDICLAFIKSPSFNGGIKDLELAVQHITEALKAIDFTDLEVSYHINLSVSTNYMNCDRYTEYSESVSNYFKAEVPDSFRTYYNLDASPISFNVPVDTPTSTLKCARDALIKLYPIV